MTDQTQERRDDETNILRKSSQEVEIDHLLAEEFCCDASFATRFLSRCKVTIEDFAVSAAIAEPSLGGEGFGDLQIEGKSGDRCVVLLVEDKITAGPAVRQAQRYAAHAARLRNQGWDEVITILVAPAAYRGERAQYDASIDLEIVRTLLRSPDPKRLAYRQQILDRALQKRLQSGVKIPDLALHALKKSYLEYAEEWCADNCFLLKFGPLAESYFDGDSWIDKIRHSQLPNNVYLRHRLWMTVNDPIGQVDLILSPATAEDVQRFYERAPDGWIASPFSKGKGVQISVQFEHMRQAIGFEPATAAKALNVMRELVGWFVSGSTPR